MHVILRSSSKYPYRVKQLNEANVFLFKINVNYSLIYTQYHFYIKLSNFHPVEIQVYR